VISRECERGRWKQHTCTTECMRVAERPLGRMLMHGHELMTGRARGEQTVPHATCVTPFCDSACMTEAAGRYTS
jgi:hypothetical protein